MSGRDRRAGESAHADMAGPGLGAGCGPGESCDPGADCGPGARDARDAGVGAEYAEALDYIHGINRFGKKLGLDNIRNLLAHMGSPQEGLRFIHIAGTNGKGSAAAMISSVLTEAGYKTGLYTSPYMQRFTERIRIDGAEIPEREVVSGARDARAAIGRMAAGGLAHPTELEVVLAIALRHYARERCDVVVLEVGMGGRFDPTNVIQAPEAAIIATISYDHVAYLGDTLEKIAFEKGGIIKSGCDAVLYPQKDSVRAVFEGICADVGARLRLCDFSTLERAEFGIRGQTFHYKRYRDLRISLLGDYQLRNAALVVDAVEALNERSGAAGAGRGGIRVPESALRRGLLRARWPGRMEVIAGAGLDENAKPGAGAGSGVLAEPCASARAGAKAGGGAGAGAGPGAAPPMVIDAAHNPECAEALKNALLQYFPGKRIVFVFGMVKDKDYAAVIDAILPVAYAVFTVAPLSERALGAEELARAARERAQVALARPQSEGPAPAQPSAPELSAQLQAPAQRQSPARLSAQPPSQPQSPALSQLSAPATAPVLARPPGGRSPARPEPGLLERIWACASVADAVSRAMALAAEVGGIACAFGSLYYIGEVRSLFGK